MLSAGNLSRVVHQCAEHFEQLTYFCLLGGACGCFGLQPAARPLADLSTGQTSAHSGPIVLRPQVQVVCMRHILISPNTFRMNVNVVS